MKMSKPGFQLFLFLFLSFSSFHFSFSQNIEWGQEVKGDKKDNGYFLKLISSNQNGIYAMRKVLSGNRYEWMIAKYDPSDFSMVDVHPIFPEGFFKDKTQLPAAFNGVYDIKGKRFALHLAVVKKDFILYKTDLDEEFSATEDPVELYRGQPKGMFAYSNAYIINFSNDSSMLLASLAGTGVTTAFNVKTFDKIDVEYPVDDKSQVTSSFMAEDGRFYLFSNATHTDDNGSNHVEYTAYEAGGGAGTKNKFSLGSGYIGHPVYKVKGDHIIICGTYSQNDQSTDVNGLFYGRIDRKTGETKAVQTYAFSKEFIDHLQKNLVSGPDQPGMVIKDVIVDADGGATMVAENQLTTVMRGTDANGRSVSTYTYYYNDIIVVKFDNQGAQVFTSIIPKKAYANSETYLGYFMTQANGKLYFFFNDHKDNAGTNDMSKVNKLKALDLTESAIVMVTIDGSGKPDKKVLQYQEAGDIYFAPMYSSRVSGSNRTLMMGFKNKVFTLGETKESMGVFNLPK